MALVNFVTFAVLKILQITTDVSKILKTVQCDLTFILNYFNVIYFNVTLPLFVLNFRL